MADFSLDDLKTLRERLGTGMVETKNALVEAGGDLEKAVELLRLRGAKGNAKRADRSTSEGLISAKENGAETTIIELSCETDFVAKGMRFVALGETVLDAAIAAGATTPEEGLAALVGSDTVEQLISNEAAILGEKIVLRRLARVTGDHFAVYLHRTSKDLPPQVGVVVGYAGDDAETARSIAQHISFADPQYLTRDEVPSADVEAERRIVEEISRNEGKPEAALPKIIEGRVRAFFKQVVLPEQDYARDNKQSIETVLRNSGLTVQAFVRFKVGS